MPNRTIYYDLPLPLPEEYYDLAVVNEVTEKTDAQLKANADAVAALAEQVAELAELEEVSAVLEELPAAAAENTSQIATLWDAVFSDITGNPFSVAFSSLAGVKVTGGVYNKAQKRLEC